MKQASEEYYNSSAHFSFTLGTATATEASGTMVQVPDMGTGQ